MKTPKKSRNLRLNGVSARLMTFPMKKSYKVVNINIVMNRPEVL